jgi:two-component system, NarL family, nitrate/nitrite response regulator NarL
MMIDVALLDADPVARYGLEEILVKTPGVRRLASVGSLADPLAGLAGTRCPGLFIMDPDFGDGPRPSAVTRLAGYAPVLILTHARRGCDVLAAIHAGARGYLTKPYHPELIANAVSTVAAGGFLLSADLLELLRGSLTLPAPVPSARLASRLSPREEQTLRYVAQGFTHSQIATRLGVSTTTVDTYIQRIRTKLGVGNKAQLTLAAVTRAAAWNGGLSQPGR